MRALTLVEFKYDSDETEIHYVQVSGRSVRRLRVALWIHERGRHRADRPGRY